MPKKITWNSDPKALQAIIEKALGPRAVDYELRFRPMFGGVLGYTCDRPFVSLSNAGLALKLKADDREKMIDEAGAYPLRYEPDDPPSKGYTIIPEEAFGAQNKILKVWLTNSIKHCKELPLKKKKKKKAAKRK